MPSSTKTQKSHAAEKAPLLWRGMAAFNHLIAHNYRRGIGPRKLVLLLTTRGRISGRPHVTPLQYEPVDAVLYVASARGPGADWFRNISVYPDVQVQIGDEKFQGTAEGLTDPKWVADFLELRMRRHPLMIRILMWLEGLPIRFTRTDLERFAAEKAVVAIHLCEAQVKPVQGEEQSDQDLVRATSGSPQQQHAEASQGERR